MLTSRGETMNEIISYGCKLGCDSNFFFNALVRELRRLAPTLRGRKKKPRLVCVSFIGGNIRREVFVV